MPFSAETLAYAKALAARKERFPDTKRALSDLLGAWNLGLAANRAERRMALRLAAGRAALQATAGPEADVTSLPAVRRVRAAQQEPGPGEGVPAPRPGADGRFLRRRDGDSGVSAPGEEDHLVLARKEGWLKYVQAPPRTPPGRLGRHALARLSPAARGDYDLARRIWHANIGPLKTPQMAAVHEDLWEITDSNMHDGDKVKGAAAIDAFPGLGKTTTALTFARQFHRREAGLHGRLTQDGSEHLPVCRVSLGAGTTIKALNQAILGFYAHPATGRYGKSTTGQLASQALDCILSCRTRLVVVDDVHFLDMRRRDGIEVSNHLKWLASEFPVTFLFAGVSLRERGLMSEGMTAADQASAQTARRWTRLTLDPFTISDDPGRRQWRSLLLAIEKHLILAGAHPGMLADDLAGYLFARTTGHIGSLMTLVNRGARRAIRRGGETLTAELLDTVKIDEAAEQARAQIQAALGAGRLNPRPRSLRGAAAAGAS